ncbi:hypothetical protein H8E50_05165, partial [bacterium]|nr:hypothetical protein [bacterium]
MKRALAATESYGDLLKESAADLAAARDELDLVDYNMLEMLANFGKVKRVQIQQVQLTGLGPVLNDMDRCQSCHMAAAKAGYEWGIHDTVAGTDNGVIGKGEPQPRRAGRVKAITEVPGGGTFTVELSR